MTSQLYITLLTAQGSNSNVWGKMQWRLMFGSQVLKPEAERAKEGSNFEVNFMLSSHAEYVKVLIRPTKSPGMSLAVKLRRSATIRFHKKCERTPPWGQPLLMLTLRVDSSCLIVMKRNETIHWWRALTLPSRLNGRATSANQLTSHGAPLGAGLAAQVRLGEGFAEPALPKDN